MKVLFVRALFCLAFLHVCAGLSLTVQQQKKMGDCGRPVCPDEKESKPPAPRPVTPAKPAARPPRVPNNGGRGNGDPPPSLAPPPLAPPPCEAAEVRVVCGLPGCEVRVDGKLRGLTNDDGELLVDELARGMRKIAISKSGYEGDARNFNLACGASETANLNLKIRPVKLRIRTNPPDAEVFVNVPPASIGRSNADGTLDYTATTPLLLLEARKQGYLADNRRLRVNPDAAQLEVVLTLKPIPAQLTLTLNVPRARVQLDSESPRPVTSEPVTLVPGEHHIEVDALGYMPVGLTLKTIAGERLKKSITLERLPVTELTAQAETAFNQRAYEDVLTLCDYVFETNAPAPAAHRLKGLTYVVRQDYAKAEAHLAQALAGGETIALQVRRHSHENFDLVKGHDACGGFLYLGKTEVEYRGQQITTENFKAPYDQMQIAGVQLKKNVAVYLATKVVDGRGKKQDYNFYSFDRELTTSGRTYLEMIQRLLRAH